MSLHEVETQDDMLAAASIWMDRDLSFVESFSEWLDAQDQSLPEPQSFSEFLTATGDSI